MLTTLRIKNLALVADLTLELKPGYNAITGETGAGKSIIIGALNLVLGGRADRTLLRAGTDQCSVEAVFDTHSVKAPLPSFLEENGLDEGDEHQLVLKRVLTASGANRQFVNGSPTTLNVLAKLGDWLVDLHGPHEHQSLLQPARQLAILDAFGSLSPRRAEFSRLVQERNRILEEKSALLIDERTYAQQLDLLRFQVREISGARLLPGEENELESEFQRASNAARLLQLTQTALGILSENDGSLLTQAGALGRTLHELQRLDASASNLTGQHDQAITVLRDLQHDLSTYADSLEFDPGRLQELEERTNLLHSLRRKYGATVAEVIAFGDEAARKLASLEERDTELERLNARQEKIEAEIIQVGRQWSAERRKLVPRLNKAVSKELHALGFQQCQFEVNISTLTAPQLFATTISGNGLDTVEFQFAPNLGEPIRPLRAIASSGEMARVMLALKTVLAAEDEVPVLIFDEVDANVGGETAAAVGEKMKQIARSHQVLCITHLAPVAAHADTHFVVSKRTDRGRTISEVELLSKARRVEELARMLGGLNAAALKHAETLLR